MMTLPITPVPKPRLTHQGRFSAAAKRYYRYAEHLRLLMAAQHVSLGDVLSVTFVLPMPHSWSQKKRQALNHQPHQQRPDLDNLLKAYKDALFVNDAQIWRYRRVEKRWGTEGQILVRLEKGA